MFDLYINAMNREGKFNVLKFLWIYAKETWLLTHMKIDTDKNFYFYVLCNVHKGSF